MTQPPDDNNNLEETLRRMRDEFGPRRPPEEPPSGDPRLLPPAPPAPERAGVISGEASPIPQPTQVRVRLPRSEPRVVWVLLGLNVLIYLLSCLLSQNLVNPSSAVLELLGWKDNELIAGGEYWRLLSATFLHGNLVHIFFNGYSLYALGPEGERIYGSQRFLALYLLAGLAGSVASYAMTPGPSVGASGAIFGLIGGLAVFYYVNRQTLGEAGRAQLQSMAAVLMINLFIGFSASGVIDNFAHLGGLAGGALAGLALAPRFSVDTRLYPPVLVRSFPAWGWAAVAGLFILLVALVLMITPP
jgi:rhomboid protease GluP